MEKQYCKQILILLLVGTLAACSGKTKSSVQRYANGNIDGSVSAVKTMLTGSALNLEQCKGSVEARISLNVRKEDGSWQKLAERETTRGEFFFEESLFAQYSTMVKSRYLLRASLCTDEVRERIVTGRTKQDLTAASSFISFVAANQPNVWELPLNDLKTIQANLPKADSLAEFKKNLLSDDKAKQVLKEKFNQSPEDLANSPAIWVPLSVAEEANIGEAIKLEGAVIHWNPDYQKAVNWYRDDTFVTDEDTVSFTPQKSDLGTVTFVVYAGAPVDLNAKPVLVDRNKPHQKTSVSIKIKKGPNFAPTLSSISGFTGGVEDTAFTLTYEALLAASDAKDRNFDDISFVVSSIKSGTLTSGGNAVAEGGVIAKGASLLWTPASNENGTIVGFEVKASDGEAASSTAVAVSIAVEAVNDAPSMATTGTLAGGSEDTSFTIAFSDLVTALTASDVEGELFQFSVTSVESGTLTKNGAAVVTNSTTLSLGESFVWTPDSNANGTLPAFKLKATDISGGTSSTSTMSVVTASVNDVPTLTSISTLSSATEDQPLTITHAQLLAASNAADVDGGSIKFRIESVNAGSVTLNGSAIVAGSTLLSPGNEVVYTPASNAVGEVSAFQVVAYDGTSASAAAIQVKANFAAVADAPTLSCPSAKTQTVAESTAITGFTCTGSDPDAGDTVTFSISNGCAGLTIVAATGVVSGNAGASSCTSTVTLTDSTGLTATDTVTLTVLQALSVAAPQTLAEGSHTYASITVADNITLTISGNSTITVVGSLTLGNNSTIVVKSKYNDAKVSGEWAGVGSTIRAANLTVPATASIHADGEGYTALTGDNTATDAFGAGPGGGYGRANGTMGSGGGHGGVGGTLSGWPATNSVSNASTTAYAPTQLGSAGGSTNGGKGGNGGGAIQIHVTGTLDLEGTIRANGASGANGWYNGAGAGGSIYVSTDTLTGAGYFEAKGGNADNNYAGGGGGGRIAIYYKTGTGFTGFFTSNAAAAATGTVAANGGTASTEGTVAFYKVTDVANHLTDATREIRVFKKFAYATESESLTFGGITVGDASATGAQLAFAGGSTVTVNGTTLITGSSSIVLKSKNNSAQVAGQWAGAGVQLSSTNMTIDSGSSLSADGQGYTAVTGAVGNGPGGGYGVSAGTMASGGGYGGIGGSHSSWPTTNSVAYGLSTSYAPTELGSAGGSCKDGGIGGNGGGAIRLNVTGTFTLEGKVQSNGAVGSGSWYNGGGSGGSIYATVGTLAGAGTFEANGADASDAYAGGGGGGRVAVYYVTATGFTGFTSSTAAAATLGRVTSPGNGITPTQGTIGFFKVTSLSNHVSEAARELVVYKKFEYSEDSTVTLGAVTVGAAAATGAQLAVGGGSVVTVSGLTHITQSSSIVLKGKNTSAQVAGAWAGVGATWKSSNMTIDAGSTLSAEGQGYAPVTAARGNGTGGGYGVAGTISNGGGHGGAGGGTSGSDGIAYGSSSAPITLGSAGGGTTDGYGGYGGGAIRLVVENTLSLAGDVNANGLSNTGSWHSGGGAGGSIYAHVGTLSGAGNFYANGGNAINLGGGGGGGRIAIYYKDNSAYSGGYTVTGGTSTQVGAGSAGSSVYQYLNWNMPMD